jgi:predicted secreted protein with PEFG-CTERM motif
MLNTAGMVRSLVISSLLVLITLITVTQHVNADEYDAQLEFAGYLEEALGHFWALEKNLDDKNAGLALVHATHPIAELYDLMKPALKEKDALFDERVQKTLLDLGKKTGSDVTRQEAQNAINDAKAIIEEARSLVVGSEMSNNVVFKAGLMIGLLETSIGEYGEAVANGQIEEMAEFQDGSSFVWRSQQIFDTIKNNLERHDSEEIEALYGDLWAAYDTKEDPEHVATLANGIINKIGAATGAKVKDVDLLVYVGNIRALLAETKVKYADGDKDEALRLATKAYLDNYEFLEPTLGDIDRELMEEIEVMLREDLRALMRNDAPQEQVNQHIDLILAKMDQVAQVVPEFGALALIILTVGIIGIILTVSKSGNLSIFKI